jgi:hypothetical protein
MTFSNNSDQKERKRVLKNDAATLHQFAQSEASEISGRWAKPQTVNASEQAVHYPRLPSNSPWASNPVPPEAPLGIDVSEPVITGEPHEVWASEQAFSWERDRPRTAAPVCAGDDDATAVNPSSPSELPRLADGDLGKGPHVASGAGNKTDAMVRPAPTNLRAQLKRRLR